jgi:multidrug resistance efflux pump
MANLSSAHVQSVAALAEFRAALVQFRAEALDGVASLQLDVRRARDWLVDQRRYWERMARECHDELTQAKTELSRKKIVPPGDRQPDTTQEEENLRRARARFTHAEEKVEHCRRWHGVLERSIEEFEGPTRRLGTRLELDLPKAAAVLERMIARLESYIGAAPPPGAVP